MRATLFEFIGDKPAVLMLVLLVSLVGIGNAEDKPGDNSVRRPKSGTTIHKLKYGGLQRTYLLHWSKKIPRQAPPLVIALHGLGADGRLMESVTGLSKLSDKEGFAVAYPDGVDHMWRFLSVPVGQPVDDVGFIDMLMDDLVQGKLADPNRIYVTGISNGAYFSHRLAVDLGDRIAAIAPVAGTMPKLLAEHLKPPRSMPVISFHGTADKIVGVDGRDAITKADLSLSAHAMAQWWAKVNDCDEKIILSLPDTAKDDTTVKRHDFAAKPGTTADVQYYEISGGGHTWPGGHLQPEGLVGPVCEDISASELIWEFCKQRTLTEPDKTR